MFRSIFNIFESYYKLLIAFHYPSPIYFDKYVKTIFEYLSMVTILPSGGINIVRLREYHFLKSLAKKIHRLRQDSEN